MPGRGSRTQEQLPVEDLRHLVLGSLQHVFVGRTLHRFRLCRSRTRTSLCPRSKPPQGFLHFPHSTSPEGRMLAWRRDSEGQIDSNRPRDVETEPAARAPSLQRRGRVASRVPERDNLHPVRRGAIRAGPREGVAGHTPPSATFSRRWRRRTRSRKGRRREWSKRGTSRRLGVRRHRVPRRATGAARGQRLTAYLEVSLPIRREACTIQRRQNVSDRGPLTEAFYVEGLTTTRWTGGRVAETISVRQSATFRSVSRTQGGDDSSSKRSQNTPRRPLPRVIGLGVGPTVKSGLGDLVLGRLSADTKPDTEREMLVLAALKGPEVLASYLGGQAEPRSPEEEAGSTAPGRRAPGRVPEGHVRSAIGIAARLLERRLALVCPVKSSERQG